MAATKGKKPPSTGGNGIGGMVPDGWYTRAEAARQVGRNPDRLKTWHRKSLAGDKAYDIASPSGHMWAGTLKVWLYNDKDIEAMKEFAANQKPGRKPVAS